MAESSTTVGAATSGPSESHSADSRGGERVSAEPVRDDAIPAAARSDICDADPIEEDDAARRTSCHPSPTWIRSKQGLRPGDPIPPPVCLVREFDRERALLIIHLLYNPMIYTMFVYNITF